MGVATPGAARGVQLPAVRKDWRLFQLRLIHHQLIALNHRTHGRPRHGGLLSGDIEGRAIGDDRVARLPTLVDDDILDLAEAVPRMDE
jgi:hypothetical protein